MVPRRKETESPKGGTIMLNVRNVILLSVLALALASLLMGNVPSASPPLSVASGQGR